ncbi:hypothetical protein [Pontibacter sp. G13]|uniref:hypothetical protein n=1 Tax=Pontibacter sp. G13 TaxID=3074898 RepID=UPI00288B2E9C|nr:hypothetical protein [Pontibacter sp. G13]WNJ16595.1 hypothetical protein RJD25_17155 [Pontibacter sp. G13]
MKKFAYILLMALTAVACNPLEDIYTEIDETASVGASNFSYTITAEDMEEFGVENFDRDNLPETMIPSLLNNKFFMVGVGSIAEVTYPFRHINDEFMDIEFPNYGDDLDAYYVSEDEYDAVGSGQYDNFYYGDDEAGTFEGVEVDNILDAKVIFILTAGVTSPAEGDLYAVFYDYFNNGSVTEQSRVYVFEGGAWVRSDEYDARPKEERLAYAFAEGIGYELEDIDYDAMGAPGRYDNFSNGTEPEDYLPQFLKINLPWAKAGDVLVVKYAYYEGSVNHYFAELTFDGAQWVITEEETFESITEQFKKGADSWTVIRPIPYTLTAADYELVEQDQYYNFAFYHEEPGEVNGVEVDNQLLAFVNIILSNNFPDTEEGTMYMLTFDYYNGSGTVQKQLLVILDGGEYVEA